jgi:hypothetical protein
MRARAVDSSGTSRVPAQHHDRQASPCPSPPREAPVDIQNHELEVGVVKLLDEVGRGKDMPLPREAKITIVSPATSIGSVRSGDNFRRLAPTPPLSGASCTVLEKAAERPTSPAEGRL